jgi:hypothetical protein
VKTSIKKGQTVCLLYVLSVAEGSSLPLRYLFNTFYKFLPTQIENKGDREAERERGREG